MPFLRRLLFSVAATLVLGVAAAFVWERIADPADWEVTRTGLSMGEAASEGQFGVVAMFVLVGVVASLALGAFAALALRSLEWVAVPVIVVLTSIAAVIAWRLGIVLGPPDPSTVKDVSVGDQVPARLAIDSIVPFLVWPVFGLVGFIVTTLLGTRLDESEQLYS